MFEKINRAIEAGLRAFLSPDPPTTSPLSTPTTPTPNTSSEPFERILTRMLEQQATQARENREMIEALMLGRPHPSGSPEPEVSTTPSQLPYDDGTTGPLPPGIEAVFAREEDETESMRRMATEREHLRRQLEEGARILAMTDPQGPSSMTFSFEE